MLTPPDDRKCVQGTANKAQINKFSNHHGSLSTFWHSTSRIIIIIIIINHTQNTDTVRKRMYTENHKKT